MNEHDKLIERLNRGSIEKHRRDQALEALMDYEQTDAEGIFVLASRQAIHEVKDELDRLKAENADLEEARFKESMAGQELARELDRWGDALTAAEAKGETFKADYRDGWLEACRFIREGVENG